MDPNYDIEKARAHLHTANSARVELINCNYLDRIDINDYQVVNIQQPLSWRVSKKVENIDFEEEVFQVQGILCAHDLPPFKTRDMASIAKKALYIRQHARLTGLGSHTFSLGIKKTKDIFNLINAWTERQTNTWEASEYEGLPAIDISARYFTPRKSVPHERGLSFESSVDPDGQLSQLRGQQYIHAADNKVIYLKERKDEDGFVTLDRIDPANFSIGDLVRASVSFVGFPTRDDKITMTIILKALTLIEALAVKKEDVRPARITPTAKTMKRKNIFEIDDNTPEGFERMSIEDDELAKDKKRKIN